jgi:tRNA(fMet)-specific endonuclease VapC
MRYVLDTNIIILYLREGVLADFVDSTFKPLDKENEAILCVVSKGELKSLAKKNDWGNKRLKKLESLCEEMLITDINSDDVIERYAEIDAFSQGRLKDKPSSFSARNMGKNDLWIAATASVINATLLTTDRDFEHLEGVFLNLEYIKMKKD